MKTRLDETNKMRKLMGLNLLTEQIIPDPQFEPIIGKLAIFKPIKDSTIARAKDGSEWNPYSEYSEKLSEKDTKTLSMFSEEKVNGKIIDAFAHRGQVVEIKLDKVGWRLSTGMSPKLKMIIYNCGERKFKLYYEPKGMTSWNPETKQDDPFVFNDKRVIVEATCDSLADFLESVLPCDGGHDFAKADSELDISDTLA